MVDRARHEDSQSLQQVIIENLPLKTIAFDKYYLKQHIKLGFDCLQKHRKAT